MRFFITNTKSALPLSLPLFLLDLSLQYGSHQQYHEQFHAVLKTFLNLVKGLDVNLLHPLAAQTTLSMKRNTV